jgi:hypothetical protein
MSDFQLHALEQFALLGSGFPRLSQPSVFFKDPGGARRVLLDLIAKLRKLTFLIHAPINTYPVL